MIWSGHLTLIFSTVFKCNLIDHKNKLRPVFTHQSLHPAVQTVAQVVQGKKIWDSLRKFQPRDLKCEELLEIGFHLKFKSIDICFIQFKEMNPPTDLLPRLYILHDSMAASPANMVKFPLESLSSIWVEVDALVSLFPAPWFH